MQRLFTILLLITLFFSIIKANAQSDIDSLCYESTLKGNQVMIAVLGGQDRELFKLLKENADFTSYGILPLIMAVRYGNVYQTKLLLAKGMNPNARISTSKITPLTEAVRYNKPEIAELLIEYGANLNDWDNFKFTPLMYSVAYGLYYMTDMLILHDAFVNLRSKETTPIHLASYHKDTAITRLLISKGADVNGIDSAGETPLILGAGKNSLPLVKLLVDSGAKVNFQTNKKYIAINLAMQNNNTNMVKYLLSKGANPSLKNAEGFDVYSIARFNHNRKALKLLEETGIQKSSIPYYYSLSMGINQNFLKGDYLLGGELDLYFRNIQLTFLTGLLKRYNKNPYYQEVLYPFETFYDNRKYFYYGIEKRFNIYTVTYYQTGIYIGLKKTIASDKYPGNETISEKNPVGISIGGFFQGRYAAHKISYEYSNFNNPHYSNNRINITTMINLNWSNYKVYSREMTIPLSISHKKSYPTYVVQ